MSIALALAVGVVRLLVATTPSTGDNDFYFPPTEGKWETVEPSKTGWNAIKLQIALDYAGDNQSSGVVVVHRGRILAEQYWDVRGARSAKYRKRIVGRDGAGRAIEDVASAQKSVASLLVGMAQQKGLLKIGNRVDQYLGKGWSKAAPGQENAITIRHLLTMTSGLTERGDFKVQAGTQWRYNTWAYSRTMLILEKVTGIDRNKLTRKWLTGPLGMDDSKWVKRTSPQLQATNGFGFATTARDLARFGLLMLASGNWGDQAILSDHTYLKEATSSSQKLNPFYGYLWWINRNTHAPNIGPRLVTAPIDMFSASGALNRRCFVVPSLHLVVTRLGDQPDAHEGFDRHFWRLLMDAHLP